MMHRHLMVGLAAIVLAAVAIPVAGDVESEKKIKIGQVPAAVKGTIEKVTVGGRGQRSGAYRPLRAA